MGYVYTLLAETGVFLYRPVLPLREAAVLALEHLGCLLVSL